MPDKKTGMLPETTEAFLRSIAARLRAARKAAGFRTEKSFATKYGIPLTTYSQHETGKRKIAIATLRHYSIIIGVDLCWLLKGKGKS